MEGVKGVEIQVPRDSSRTSNPGNHDDVVFFQPQVFDGPDQVVHDNAMAASGTPNVGQESLTHKILCSHNLDPLALNEAQDISNVGGGYEGPIHPVGKKDLLRVVQGLLNLL